STFTVTVEDEEKPLITVPANIVVAAAQGQCSSNVVFEVSATDNCEVPSVTADPPSGSAFPIGTTVVDVTATDTHGNETKLSFTVAVEDEEKPLITVPANILVAAASGQCGSNVVFEVSATDNCEVLS